MKNIKKLGKNAIMSALALSVGAAASTSAVDNAIKDPLFSLKEVNTQTILIAHGGEGSCGEGKCGSNKATTKAKSSESKCGEGKCGGKKKEAKKTKKQKKEAATKAKSAESKCGEGTCGSEGKCGAGKKN